MTVELVTKSIINNNQRLRRLCMSMYVNKYTWRRTVLYVTRDLPEIKNFIFFKWFFSRNYFSKVLVNNMCNCKRSEECNDAINKNYAQSLLSLL